MAVLQIPQGSLDVHNHEWSLRATRALPELGSTRHRIGRTHASAALLCTLPVLAVPALAFEPEHHWSYSGTSGPSHWSLLEPDYRLCALGKAQSPIDIASARVRARDVPPLAFKYLSDTVRVVDNGHTVEVRVAHGSEFHVGTDRYSLVQLHFHRPSEETIDGKRFPMSAHFVHVDAVGHVAVVAVPIQAGAPNE